MSLLWGQSWTAAFLPREGVWLGLHPLHPEQTGGLLRGNGLQCWGLNHSGVAVGVCPSRVHVGRDGWWSGTVYQRTKDKWVLEKKKTSLWSSSTIIPALGSRWPHAALIIIWLFLEDARKIKHVHSPLPGVRQQAETYPETSHLYAPALSVRCIIYSCGFSPLISLFRSSIFSSYHSVLCCIMSHAPYTEQ